MAIEKFNLVKEKRILLCIVDNTNKCQSGWAKEVSKNFSDFFIHRADLYRFDIYIGEDEMELIKEACADTFYTHAVMVSTGTSLGLSDRLFSEIEKACNQDFFIAGHILDRGDSYYELHHQFYIINLQDYKDLGFPNIAQGSWSQLDAHTSVEPVRSEEYLHGDKQVTTWIRKGTSLRTYNRKLHGWDLITTALENDKKVIDLGPGIRDNKRYYYYEHDHVFLKEISEMYYNEFFCIHFITAWNSDHINNSIDFKGPVEQYVTVGTGYNWIRNLNIVGFTEETTVVFTDNNLNVLNFMKSMVEEWDGKDYASFYKSKLGIIPHGTKVDIDRYIKLTAEAWEKFVSTFDNWEELFSRIKKLNYQFIHLDYCSSYNLDWLAQGKNTLVNLSDLANHVPYVGTHPLKYRIACENRFLNNIKERDPNIVLMLTTRASHGFTDVKDNMIIGKITDYKLTDINDLKAPPWHKDDWKSFCILTGNSKILG